MHIDFIYPKHYDLVLHVLAHIKVNNASNLYDAKYIKKMTAEKQGYAYNLIPAVKPLQEYYNNHFERLMLINFLPCYCNNYEEMKNIFLTCSSFTMDNIEMFIKPFVEIMDNESLFFFDYWEKLNKSHEPSKRLAESYFRGALTKYAFFFDYYNLDCRVLFSYSITNNGRGVHDNARFAALVRFPEDERAYAFSFIQLLHEYTHRVTDGLLKGNINMDDGSHDLSETAVILTDYYLIKHTDPNFMPAYLSWAGALYNEDLSEGKFLNTFKVNDALEAEIQRLLNAIYLTSPA